MIYIMPRYEKKSFVFDVRASKWLQNRLGRSKGTKKCTRKTVLRQRYKNLRN